MYCFFILIPIQDSQAEEAERDLQKLTIFVFRKEGEELFHTPEDVGIIVEGVEVLNQLTSFASACAVLSCVHSEPELSKRAQIYLQGVPKDLHGPGGSEEILQSTNFMYQATLR